MSKLSALEVRNAKPEKKGYKLLDGKGLHLFVSSTGVKSWRYRFKLGSKESMFTLGQYPEMGLGDARKELSACRELVKQGLDPVTERKKAKQQQIDNALAEEQEVKNSFENVAYDWINQQSGKWSDNHSKAVVRSLKNDVFPFIGSKPITAITPPMILEVVRAMEKREALVLASKALQRMTAVFRYAVQTGIAEVNPATEMKGVVKTRKTTHQLSLSRDELPEFLKRLSTYKLHITTKSALKFTILTACRTGETRGARWSEIDLESGIWVIPAERMKMGTTHTVPLSRQAIEILETVGKAWGKIGFVFNGIRQETKQLSQDTMQKAVWSLGYKSKASVHGFRATFSTIANETGFNFDHIERSLAHQERNKVRGAYNHSEYLDQRRELMQWWADLLDQLEHGAEIIPFKANKK